MGLDMNVTIVALSVLVAPHRVGMPEGRSRPDVPCKSGYDAEIGAAVREVASLWPVPPPLVKAIIRQESAFDPNALSSAGAVGLMQVLPRNAEALGMTREELWEPRRNILAGTRLLAVLLRHYQGDVISALVAYNTRPRKLHAPLPDNRETAPYVLEVLWGWRAFERC
jgi:soluble lytic murein transglycosylase-like protein